MAEQVSSQITAGNDEAMGYTRTADNLVPTNGTSNGVVNSVVEGVSNLVNGQGSSEAKGLKILIVGAGLGGLTAAIALRKVGHDVHVYEQSRFASELGAAVHLAPNANGILRRLGIYAEEFGSNPTEILSEYTPAGEQLRYIELKESNKQWQHPWHLAHRVHLHSKLKETATAAEGEGKPADLHTSSRVVDVNPHEATITLEDGQTVKGDLVIGADGVHSITRRKIPGGDVKPFGSGKSAFRFLIPKKVVLEDPEIKHLARRDGELTIWYGNDRRVVVYPTTNNTLLNFVCIHPEAESEAGDDWNQEGNLKKMLDVYKEFNTDVLKLLAKADPQTLKVWKLLDMEVIPSWINDKLALLGDAAHPFLPHQGQGAGVAMEDAAALSVVLPIDTPKEEIADRLKLYEKIRYERANRIQEYSRIAGADQKDVRKLDMIAYTNYNFGFDEFDHSTQVFREYTWAKVPPMYWRQPISFGPMPGPRQNFYGKVREATQSTFTTASIKFKTSRTLLQNLFPPGKPGYRFKSPGTVAYASISQTSLNKMEWLGGSGYNHLGLYIHGVEFVKPDGTVLNGTFMPILFESLTDPIVSGREELGMPKLYSSVEIHRRAESYNITTGWQGATWGRFSLTGLKEIDPKTEAGNVSGEADDGIFVYRYSPKVGRAYKGEADADYPVFVPFAEDFPEPKPQRVLKADKAEFKIDGLDWDALPTLHHIISRMAELPVYEIVSGKVVEGVGVPDVGAAKRIE